MNYLNLMEGIVPEMSEMERRVKVCENLKKEIQNRTAFEISHYLSDFVYNTIGFKFVITLELPVALHEFDTLFGDTEINREKS